MGAVRIRCSAATERHADPALNSAGQLMADWLDSNGIAPRAPRPQVHLYGPFPQIDAT